MSPHTSSFLKQSLQPAAAKLVRDASISDKVIVEMTPCLAHEECVWLEPQADAVKAVNVLPWFVDLIFISLKIGNLKFTGTIRRGGTKSMEKGFRLIFFEVESYLQEPNADATSQFDGHRRINLQHVA